MPFFILSLQYPQTLSHVTAPRSMVRFLRQLEPPALLRPLRVPVIGEQVFGQDYCHYNQISLGQWLICIFEILAKTTWVP